ncbi:hydroxyethylthiazole kinase [Mannheimia massilioguelmaensis]|uniref:hydroxyethylthiazole kinase n=1 Tax=Mannheimia massilioguelmaensis TaxID=1604354 RepID=UPI0005CB35AE|nr:hydroxyethylthiazole kinase [Mannheimia massilioguelmaensis]
MQTHYLELIRQKNPLVHCITNIVVTNFSANGLLALGASPFMSTMPKEVAEIQDFAQGLLINIGTIHPADIEAMLIAGKAANQLDIPVVFDPVGVGATKFRQQVTHQLLSQIKVAVIRGNAAEIAFLAEGCWQGKGVDAAGNDADLNIIAKTVAQKYQCIVAISGETDVISDGSLLCSIHNGSSMLPKVTGSGCLLGAVIAAFLGVAEKDSYFSACVEACATYAVAGELAMQGLLPTEYGSFAVNFINQLGAITSAQVQRVSKINKK